MVAKDSKVLCANETSALLKAARLRSFRAAREMEEIGKSLLSSREFKFIKPKWRLKLLFINIPRAPAVAAV